MDAAKFVREFRRICNKHNRCANCLLNKTLLCDSKKELSQKESEKIVEIIENWSKENPDIIGKKYIIELDKVDFNSTCERTMLRIKGVKYDGGEVWLDKALMEQLTESEECY